MPTKLPTISHARGRGQMNHNNREHKSFGANVDTARIKDNATYIREDLMTAYEKCYGQAQRDFDSKQKRDDRKIVDYYTHLFGEAPKTSIATAPKGQQSYYEIVVGIGDMLTCPVGSEQGELASKVLDEYMQDFQRRNPNFYVFNAVKHMDEKTPHIHLNYIPVANYYVRGMEVQNGHAKALEQMGFGNKKSSIDEWRKNERAVIRELCKVHGIELAEETKGRGKTLTPNEYKIIRDEVKEEVKNELRTEPEIIDELKAELRDDFIAEHRQELINKAKTDAENEIEKIKTSTESDVEKAKDDANKRLAEALAPIEEKIDVALAEKANSNVIKDIAVKKGLTGGIVLSRKSKDKTLSIKQVESALELAKNQRTHELRCNSKVEKAQGEVKSMKTELEEQKDITKTATNAWTDTLKTLEGRTLNGIKIFTHDNIAKTVKYLVDGFFTHKKAAEQVPELERQVDTLKQNQATHKQREFSKLPHDIQDAVMQHGKQLVEQSRQQAEQARLAQFQAQQVEKQRIQSLHKTKHWSELTAEERKEVRRLLVNAPEFENRQDYLDFKRAFGSYVERGR